MSAITKRTTVRAPGTTLGLLNIHALHPEIPETATIIDVSVELEEERNFFEAESRIVGSWVTFTLEWPA